MIKLLIPDMPKAEEVFDYLKSMDSKKVYVNNGPLVKQLEERLEEITQAPCVTVANGTLALELTLTALFENTHQEFELGIPALTFSATGLSAHRAGFRTRLLDVDPDYWRLSRRTVEQDIKDHWLFKMDGVMPTAAFGMAYDPSEWEGLEIPVVIDAAGAFPAQLVSQDANIITCFSLHATKFIGCGEGGFVSTKNAWAINRIRDLASFGEHGTNAKMSEYHAAVALASLDRMETKQERTCEVIQWYLNEGLGSFPNNIIESNFTLLHNTHTLLVVELPVPAEWVQKKMLEAGIETKQWYRPFLNERAEFATYHSLPVTDNLSRYLLGLPFHNYLTEEDVKYIGSTLRGLIK